MLNSLFFLLEGETTTPSGLPSWVTFVMLGGVAVFFYFFMIRPQRKQEKEANNMRNSLEIGDEVVTIGGIIGQIVSIKGDTVTIATSKDRNKIRFLKTAIREVTVKANAPIEDAPEAAAEASDDAPVIKD